jgi:hypothetical protein
MHLLWGRYSRSGYASAWFLRALAVAFVALAVWGGVRGDWLVLALGLVMAPITLAAIPLTRRLAEGLQASQRNMEAERDARHG